MPPPPLPINPKLRTAQWVNVFLPGAGLIVLGDLKFGLIITCLFLACFLAVIGIFIYGYGSYLNTAFSPDILEGHKLEEIGQNFHSSWLLALGGVGVVLYAIAMIRFHQLKSRL